ncbi:MAG: glycosyltransferase family 2 protein [Thermodesulfobacteriota bacterium]
MALSNMLSIIIVNYNGVKFLTECLNSIEEHVSRPHEVIVVDNASTDGSVELIKENFQRVRLIRSGENRGFSGGNNIGARRASGELMLLLNNDTRLLTPLDAAIEEFGRDERLGALGCRMYYGDGRKQPSIGFEATPLRLVLSWLGLGRFAFLPDIFRRVEMDEKQYARRQDNVAWVSGAFLMTRKSVWDRLGGLDERYFMYMEDVDYCKRVRMEGFRVAYIPEVEMVHYVGSAKEWIGEKALLNTMNSYIEYTKQFQRRWLLFLRFFLSAVMLLRVIAYSVQSFFSASGVVRDKARAFMRASFRLLSAKE